MNDGELQDVVTLDGPPGTRLRVCVAAASGAVFFYALDAKGNRKGSGLRLSPTQAGCLGNGLLMARKRALEAADERGKR